MTPIDRIIVDPPLTQIRADLRKAGKDFPKKLQKVNKEVAQAVAEDTREAYQRGRYTMRSGDGLKSIRALATQTRAQVAIGGARAPYLPGQNFGSNKVMQFAPKVNPDRFLYTTIAKRKEEIEKQHGEMVDDLMDEAFPRYGLALLRDVLNG
jgi:hypothetical protein